MLYSYPHVEISTKALPRRTPAVVESTATTLLAPFMCDRGPANELVAIDKISDFNSYFGTLDYSKANQRQILNIGNWLTAGGRVLACRIVPEKQYQTIKKMEKSDVITEEQAQIVSFQWSGNTTSNADFTLKYVAAPTVEGSTDVYVPEIELTYGGETYYFATKEATGSEKYRHATTEAIETGYYDFYKDSKLANALIVSKSIEITENSVSETKKISTFVDNIELGCICTDSDTCNLVIYTKSDKFILSGISIERKSSVKINKCASAAYSISLSENEAVSTIGLSVQAKYFGTYYDNLSVRITKSSSNSDKNLLYFNIRVYNDSNLNSAIESYNNVSFDKLYTLSSSSYIGIPEFKIDNAPITDLSKDGVFNKIQALFSSSNGVLLKLSGASDATESDDIEDYLVDSLRTILAKPLETPFDTLIDCGYSLATKQNLISLFCASSTDIKVISRTDAFLVLSLYAFSKGNDGTAAPDLVESDQVLPVNEILNGIQCNFVNTGIFTQYEKVEDIYSAKAGKEVYVPTTYFLAGLLPKNDALYGPQFPTAGLTRGVVSGISYINELPTNAEKQDNYNNHINYIEKDSRGQYIMCELTGTHDDTALKFIKNVRSLLKIKKELTNIARSYLHEFNDRITKANLLNALNVVLSNWIQNRTLSYGSIDALQDYTQNATLSNEQLLITLSIKFTGTIEVISIDITAE